MTRESVANAIAALESEGRDITNRAIQQRIGGSMRDIQRHRAQLAAEAASGGAVAVHDVVEDPAADAVPREEAWGHRAQARLEAAQQDLARLNRELAPALNQRLMLVTALRQGVITRQDPAWRPHDEASQQIAAATQAVSQAEEDLKAAQRAGQARLREQALERVAQTPEGQALLAKIEACQAQKQANDHFEGAGMYIGMTVQLGRLHQQLQRLIAQELPQAAPPAPVDLTPLRQYYESRLDGKPTPVLVRDLDHTLLKHLLAAVQDDIAQAGRDVRTYEHDPEMMNRAAQSPEQLPYRQALERYNRFWHMAEMMKHDLLVLEQRARAEGHTA